MIWRIRSRSVFEELRVRGLRVRSGPVRMSYVSLASPCPQVGFAIGRRFGSAVERNRARRRLRAAFTTAIAASPDAPCGAYLISADRAVLEAGYDRLVQAVGNCLGQIAQRASTSGARP